MGYMGSSRILVDYDNDGTRDGIITQLNVGNGLTGTLINGVLSLEASGGGGTIYDGTITLAAGTNMSGGGDFTTNQNAAETITFDGLSNAQIQALITGTSPISVSNGVVSFTGGLNDLSDVTITSPADGDALLYNGSAWVNSPRDVAFIRVKNDTLSTLNKGEVVYISGPHNSNVADVELARANSSTTMPAIGVLYQTLNAGDEGLAVIYGKANGIALPSPTFSEGDIVYVSTTTAGGVTATKPTGASDLIQNIGIVMQTHATNGVLFMTGVGRSNDVPNSFSIAGDITTTGDVSGADGTFTGDVSIGGKLTVTGLIDPTGLELTPVSANPGGVAANTIWQDSGNSNQWKIGANRVVDAGNISTIAGGAGFVTDLSGFDTGDLAEGSNQYYTDTRSRSAVSVGTPAAASGSGSISYVSGTGVFTYTPPDLSGYLTSYTETNDLTAAVTWANVPDANITQSSVTQHQAALSITESQISDLGTYQTQNAVLTDLAGLSQATDKLPYFDSATTAATTTLTSFARTLLDDADAATARTTLGVDAAGTDNSTDVTLATVTDNYLSISSQQITAGTVPVSLGGTGSTTASAARTALGVDAAGTDNSTPVTLASVASNYLSLSGQQITAGTVPISLGGTGSTTASAARTALGVDAAGTDNSTPVTLATVSGNYLSLSGQEITAGTVPVSLGGTGSTTAANARTALGLAIDTDVQAYDADLSAIAALSSADGNFIVGSATGWVAESGSTARTSLGLGTAATSDTGDFATAAQGTNADTAFGWGNHASAGYLTSYTETDTLNDVVGRGSSTTSAITVGGLTVDTNTLSVDTVNNRVGLGTTSPKTRLTVEGSVTLKEQAAADTDSAAYGQLWVKTGTPNELYFTNDAGTDIRLDSETDSVVGGINGLVKSDGGGNISAAVEDTDYQGVLAEGAFADGDKTKLDGIDSNATANTGALADLDTVGTSEIDDDAVTYAKIQNVSATDRLLGRDSAGAGVIEEITPANVRTMLNIADGATNTAAPAIEDNSGTPAFATGITKAEVQTLLNVADGATANTGTVTSVDMTVPTGFVVSGNPITTAGTLAVAYDTGYQGFTTTESTKLSGIATGATAYTDADAIAAVEGEAGLDFSTSSNDAIVENTAQDKDIIFKINDGGTPTEVLRIDGSTGNVGIRLNQNVTADERLDVEDGNISLTTTSRTTERLIKLRNSGSTTSLSEIAMAGANSNNYEGYIAFKTKGPSDLYNDPLNEIMRIDGNGNVGIGTTTPAAELHIEGSANPTLRISETGQNGYATFTSVVDSQARIEAVNDTASEGILIDINPKCNASTGTIQEVRIFRDSRSGIDGNFRVKQVGTNTDVLSVYSDKDGTAHTMTMNGTIAQSVTSAVLVADGSGIISAASTLQDVAYYQAQPPLPPGPGAPPAIGNWHAPVPAVFTGWIDIGGYYVPAFQ